MKQRAKGLKGNCEAEIKWKRRPLRQSKTLLWAFWAAALSLPSERAWCFPEWQGRWGYLPLWLIFPEKMHTCVVWGDRRGRDDLYIDISASWGLWGWEDERQRSFVRGQMAPCLFKEEQWKNGHKRWSHRGRCLPFRKLGPFIPASLCGSTAERALLGARTRTKQHSGGWRCTAAGQIYTETSTKQPHTLGSAAWINAIILNWTGKKTPFSRYIEFVSKAQCKLIKVWKYCGRRDYNFATMGPNDFTFIYDETCMKSLQDYHNK